MDDIYHFALLNYCDIIYIEKYVENLWGVFYMNSKILYLLNMMGIVVLGCSSSSSYAEPLKKGQVVSFRDGSRFVVDSSKSDGDNYHKIRTDKDGNKYDDHIKYNTNSFSGTFFDDEGYKSKISSISRVSSYSSRLRDDNDITDKFDSSDDLYESNSDDNHDNDGNDGFND